MFFKADLISLIYYYVVTLLPGHLVFKLLLLLFNLGRGRSCTAWSCYAATVKKKAWNLMMLKPRHCITVEPSDVTGLANKLNSTMPSDKQLLNYAYPGQLLLQLSKLKSLLFYFKIMIYSGDDLPFGQVSTEVTCPARKSAHPRQLDGNFVEPWVIQ